MTKGEHTFCAFTYVQDKTYIPSTTLLCEGIINSVSVQKSNRISCAMQTSITKTCLYNFDSLKPHIYIVKLGFTGVYIIFFSDFAKKKKIVVLIRTASPWRFNEYPQCFEQNYEKYLNFFYLKIFLFWL